MQKIISEDALRRALSRMSAEQSNSWLVPQLMASVQSALSTPWILDIDTTIKPLYGKQEGAQVSYNPHKPGRLRHALHTCWVGNLRLVLDVVVSPGKEHSAGKARPGLVGVLDKLEPKQRPALVRGDCGFGNEPFIAELEERGQPYLFPSCARRRASRSCLPANLPGMTGAHLARAIRAGALCRTHSSSQVGTNTVG